jgi:hypothetical protein
MSSVVRHPAVGYWKQESRRQKQDVLVDRRLARRPSEESDHHDGESHGNRENDQWTVALYTLSDARQFVWTPLNRGVTCATDSLPHLEIQVLVARHAEGDA